VLKFGRITGIKADEGKFQVTFDDDKLVSGWLPGAVPNTKANKDECPFDQDEHVACLMDERLEYGVVICAIYDTKNKPVIGNKDVRTTKYSDGSFIKFDRAAKKLTVSCEGDIEIVKSTNTKITASQKITLTPGTVIELAGSVDNAVKHLALDTALQTFVTAVNVELGKIATGLNAIVPASYVVLPTTLNISSAKVTEVKTS
jgi:phage baseplate assembly protein V